MPMSAYRWFTHVPRAGHWICVSVAIPPESSWLRWYGVVSYRQGETDLESRRAPGRMNQWSEQCTSLVVVVPPSCLPDSDDKSRYG